MSTCVDVYHDELEAIHNIIKTLLRENEVLTKRIEELERYPSLIKHLDINKQEHFEILIKLENENKQLIKRIEKLELKMQMPHVANQIYPDKEPKPYKCSLCNGNGTISKTIRIEEDIQLNSHQLYKDDLILIKNKCHSCEGNGTA